MADLTSNIRITGMIDGRKIEFAHEYTLENIYDAGQRTYGTWGWSVQYVAPFPSTSAPPSYVQDTPTYLLLRNTSVNYPCRVNFDGINDLDFWLWPGQTVILNANSTSSGMANYTNASGETTMDDPGNIIFDNLNTGNYGGSPYAMWAFNAIS